MISNGHFVNLWESHLELPHIDLDDLEDFVTNI